MPSRTSIAAASLCSPAMTLSSREPGSCLEGAACVGLAAHTAGAPWASPFTSQSLSVLIRDMGMILTCSTGCGKEYICNRGSGPWNIAWPIITAPLWSPHCYLPHGLAGASVRSWVKGAGPVTEYGLGVRVCVTERVTRADRGLGSPRPRSGSGVHEKNSQNWGRWF